MNQRIPFLTAHQKQRFVTIPTEAPSNWAYADADSSAGCSNFRAKARLSTAWHICVITGQHLPVNLGVREKSRKFFGPSRRSRRELWPDRRARRARSP